MRARGRVSVGKWVATLLACCAWAFALDPSLDISQYAHAAWKMREGFTKSFITSIAQTPDGYLWLGTDLGLTRFDGIRNIIWQPPDRQELPSSQIRALFGSPDGTLWIGTLKGLASWKDGRLTQYPQLAGQAINAIVAAGDGTIWVGGAAFPGPGKLCAIRNAVVECYGEDGKFGNGISSLFTDRQGRLWMGTVAGLWRWLPGPPTFYPISNNNGIVGLAEDADGGLLISLRKGISRFADGKTEVIYPTPPQLRQLDSLRLLRDRDGGLWWGSYGGGLVHVHQGKTDVFAKNDGLTGDSIAAIFEDAEGSVWVATTSGLDRFRAYAVSSLSTDQGLSNDVVTSVAAAADGSVWVGTFDGLNRLLDGQITIYRHQHPLGTQSRPLNVHEITDSGLPLHGVMSMIPDARGRVWLGMIVGFGYLENGRFTQIPEIPGGQFYPIASGTDEDIWVGQSDDLLRIRSGHVIEKIPWASLPQKTEAGALEPDPVGDGVWAGFYQGGLAHIVEGKLRTWYTTADGLGGGPVSQIRFDPEGILWAATTGGLSRLKDGQIATLTSKSGLPCDAVHWSLEDDDRSLWLHMQCGLVRIARSEMESWLNDSRRSVQVMVLDSSDGVSLFANPGGYGPHAARSADGRIWFKTPDGLSVFDPRHLPFNKLPPPVHIVQITADHKTYDLNSNVAGQVRLPPRIRDLQIDYTALSLVAPEKVLFRYKLEGWDPDWQDAGTRRQAFYSNLPPRNYTFRVMACNNSGVWNEAGTFLDFSVAPAYYQTLWFRSLCVIAVLALLAALYRLRSQQVARQFNVRLEERVSERTRIARDLHDTLLQSFQGVLMKFDVATAMLPDSFAEPRKILETTVEQARKAITEGREVVQGLRSSTVVTNELARAIGTIGEELAAVPSDGNFANFRVLVEGASKDMVPLIRDEVYRIACESLRNAFRHAHAKRIEVELYYDPRKFRLRVCDNGRGIDAKVLAEGGASGHFGLPGMQERARLVRGKLTVRSGRDSGTEIEFTIPASVAYTKSPTAHRPISFRKGA